MSSKVNRKDFDQYLREAKTWETDKVKQAQSSKKTAWTLACVGIAVGLFGIAAATMQATHDPAPPVVLRVDNTTGIVDVVNALSNGKTNYEEVTNKYFTQLYVRFREGYSRELAEDYYYNTGLMSDTLEQQKYFGAFNPKNPQSPINIYGEFAKVKIRVKGTTFIKPNVALVRYVKDIERGTDKPQSTHWTATITFKYGGAPMKDQDRAINPLGFRVAEYRNDPDALQQDATAPQAAEAVPAPAPAGPTVFAGAGQAANPPAPAAVPYPTAVPAIQSLK